MPVLNSRPFVLVADEFNGSINFNLWFKTPGADEEFTQSEAVDAADPSHARL
jgi:hypothetical protein